MKTVLVVATLALSSISLPSQTPNVTHRFPVFDAASIGFIQRPDLKASGLKSITLVSANFMWEGSKVPPDITSLPDKSRVMAITELAAQSSNILVIDIEHWPLTGNPAAVSGSVQRYRTVINWFKSFGGPELKVGLYGVAPIRDYWDAIPGKGSAGYLTWQKQNDAVAPAVQFADILFPSIYTFYDDQSGWQKYAIAQIQEARRYAGGKPVYVFLWPQFHESNKKIGGTFLPGDYWRMELETSRKYADGIVIWCCSSQQPWDEKAPWWLETKAFIKEVNANQ